MSWGIYGAFFFAVALLFVPLDAQFVRASSTRTTGCVLAAIGAAVSYAVWARMAFAVAAVVIAVLVGLLRIYFPRAMEAGRRPDLGQ